MEKLIPLEVQNDTMRQSYNSLNISLATILFLTILVFQTEAIQAQQNEKGLLKVWQNTSKHDTTRLNALYKLIDEVYLRANADKASHYISEMYDFGKKKNMLYAGKALELRGRLTSERGNNVEAMDYYERALAVYKKHGTNSHRAHLIRRIAQTHINLGEIDIALNQFSQVMEIAQRTNDNELLAKVFNNLGALHEKLMNFDKGLYYQKKSLELGKKMNSPSSIAKAYNNIGIMYANKKQVDSVYLYSTYAENAYREMGDSMGVIRSIAIKGVLYRQLGDFDKALPYFTKILDLAREVEHQGMSLSALGELTNIYLKTGKYKLAEEYGLETLQLAEKLKAKVYISIASERLYKVYKKLNKPVEALAMFERTQRVNEQLLDEEGKQKIIHQEYQYKYLKKNIADSVAHAKEKKITTATLAKERAENNAYRSRQTLLYGGLGTLLVFLAFVYNRFRVVKKQKGIIEIQKKKVEEQKEIIEEAAKTKLEYEQLKQEHLKADLTNAAQEISRRQEWLEQFKEKLYKVKSLNIKADELSEVFVDIANQMQLDARNQEFYKNIDQVNQEFFHRLREQFPTITQKEQELCGLIRLNLSTKEIASVRNVEAHSIRIARSRLRKRLGLERTENLFDFLQAL